MNLICVGAIAGAFGVRGEVRLKSFCAVPEEIALYSPLTDEAGKETYALKITRPIKAGFAARITGVDNKEAADALRGTSLYVGRDALPNLPDDEYYHTDLIGLDVVDTGGKRIGRVQSLIDNGVTDLLEVRGKGLKNGIVVPFTRAIVPTVDLAAGRLIIDPPDGILPGTGSDNDDE